MTNQTTGNTEPQGGPSRELLEALGWLTVAYSILEAEVAFGIWEIVDNTNSQKGAAITAGRRLLDLADVYVALAETDAPQAATEFSKLRSRIQAVNSGRNQFVHSVWTTHALNKGKDFRYGSKVRGGKGLQSKLELTDPTLVRRVGDDAHRLSAEIAEIRQRCIKSDEQPSV